MLSRLPRPVRFALPVLAAFGLVAQPLVAQQRAPAPAAVSSEVPWLYKGSDIPVDPAWKFGVLPNGVRYAVRRNGVPPRQVSVRVGIEAGSMMERENERGYAHFMEHLSFRGSKYIADGEAIKTWQRLGATFGSDTNAVTTPTQTIYKLDLPSATAAGLDESLKILSGMMEAPTIAPAAVEGERRTVLAEAREQTGAQVRVSDATRNLFFAGQLFAERPPIGTTESLNAATAASMRAFHDRWYRPDRAIVVISGDADPAIFEQMIQRHFSAWRPRGPAVADPSFGRPDPKAAQANVITEPGLPTILSMATLRPWVQKNDTVAYNQGKLLDLVAIRLINRRLETRARAGASYLQATVDQQDVSRSVDGTFVQIVPIGDDWKAALKDVRAVIADAMANPAPQDEIDREVGEFVAALDVGVETERTEAGAKLADDILEAVDIRETVATAQVAREVFGGMRSKVTPQAILASSRKLFTGTGPRVLLTTPTEIANGQMELTTALKMDAGSAVRTAQAPVSFDRLPKPGTPGTIASREPLADIGMEIVTLSNGVRVLLFPSTAEANKVLVTARFGGGLNALPNDRTTVAWAGSAALIASGVGDLGQDELDRLTSGRRINMGFEITDNAFQLRSTTRAADLSDQLRLLAAKLEHPRWDVAPVARARAALLTGFDTYQASPQGVLGRELGALLRANDPRWRAPTREEVSALDAASFRALWEPLLATGPVELMIFGDFETEATLKAVLATFGAMKPRGAAARLTPPPPAPAPAPQPVVRMHRGPADQAAAVLAWPTSGGLAGIYESRKLEILSQIFNDRLFNQLRDGEGASYSPQSSSGWPTGMEDGGRFIVVSQLKPEGVERFFVLAREIAADLAARPVSDDELQRAVGPMRQLIARVSSGNTFWMTQTMGATYDRRRFAALGSMQSDFARITPAELQETARRYFVPAKAFSFVVLPEKK